MSTSIPGLPVTQAQQFSVFGACSNEFRFAYKTSGDAVFNCNA